MKNAECGMPNLDGDFPTREIDGTKYVELGQETGMQVMWLLFVSVVEENDWKAFDLLISFHEIDVAWMAAVLAKAKLAYFASSAPALPRRSGALRTRSNRRGRSIVSVPMHWLPVSDIARAISLLESRVTQ